MHKVRRQFWLLLILGAIFLLSWVFTGQRGTAAPQDAPRPLDATPANALPATSPTSAPTSAPYVWNFKDPVKAVGSATKHSDTDSLVAKSLVCTLLVLVLGTVAIYVGKRWFPRLTSQAGKHMQVVESINLCTRHKVHLLKVSGKCVLIGTSGDRMTMLGDLPGDAIAASAQTINSEESLPEAEE